MEVVVKRLHFDILVNWFPNEKLPSNGSPDKSEGFRNDKWERKEEKKKSCCINVH